MDVAIAAAHVLKDAVLDLPAEFFHPGTNDPNRAVSEIYVDPANAHHAWISYNGYNVNTPAQPGHVFEVTWSGSGAATWADRSYNLPDFPITAVVRDDVTGDLYAASDSESCGSPMRRRRGRSPAQACRRSKSPG